MRKVCSGLYEYGPSPGKEPEGRVPEEYVPTAGRQRDRVLDVLRHANAPVRVRYLAAILEIKTGPVGRVLDRLLDDPTSGVVRTEDSRYYLRGAASDPARETSGGQNGNGPT